MFQLLTQTLVAFVATVAFGVLFQVPREQYAFSGICGAAGWLCYLLVMQNYPSTTIASFAAAVAIRLWNKKEGIGALVLAALISFSRLYLTVHYPTDVLASVVFGSAYGGAAYLLMKKVLEKPGRLRKVLVEGASYKTLWKK